MLAVLGNAAGVAAASGAAGAGTGFATAMRIGWSAGGGGGGGIVPASALFTETSVIGSSTTFVAETLIPFFRPQASNSCPSMLNF